MLLSRTDFRAHVFARDQYACCWCGRPLTEPGSDVIINELDPHHIMERALWAGPDEPFPGGYLLDNGATLCQQECHRLAEEGSITPAQLWDRLGVGNPLLPTVLLPDNQPPQSYDKWGNYQLDEHHWVAGPLFAQPQVQTLLRRQGKLWMFHTS